MALTLLVIAAITVAVSWLGPAGPRLTGGASVVDGDTLRFGQTRIRLLGIDAPELEQPCTDATGKAFSCGDAARQYLVKTIGGRQTTCTASGHDRYRRVLAHCFVDDVDLSRAIAEAGWAVAEADYLGPQLAARAAGRGIWAGRFEQPADWRRDHGENKPDVWSWLQSLF